MAYDPQRDRRRPRPGTGEAAPIDALLDVVEPAADVPVPTGVVAGHADAAEPAADGPAPASPVRGPDPPPPVSVTPGPADPWSDRQLLQAVVASAVLTLAAAMAARWYWPRLRHRFHARR